MLITIIQMLIRIIHLAVMTKIRDECQKRIMDKSVLEKFIVRLLDLTELVDFCVGDPTEPAVETVRESSPVDSVFHEVEDETDGVDTQSMSTEPELIVELVVENPRKFTRLDVSRG